jgi:hypothetical protein
MQNQNKSNRSTDFVCTGVGPTPFTTSLPFLKTKAGRLAVDSQLRCSLLPAVSFIDSPSGDKDRDPHPGASWKGAMTVQGLEDPGTAPEGMVKTPGPSSSATSTTSSSSSSFVASSAAVAAGMNLSAPGGSSSSGAVDGNNGSQKTMAAVPPAAAAAAAGVETKEEERRPVTLNNVFALGDCCANLDRPLPALAQVAEQQGRYLAKLLNARVNEPGFAPAFVYRSLGAMATTGGASVSAQVFFFHVGLALFPSRRVPSPFSFLFFFSHSTVCAFFLQLKCTSSKQAVLELYPSNPKRGRLSFHGFLSWVAWRSAYLTRLGNFRNRLYVAVNWATTLVMGRDLSRW